MYCKACGTVLQDGTCPKCSAGKNGGSAMALIAMVPAFLMALTYLVAPLFKALLLSLKSYSLARGLFGSAWVGLQNFLAVVESAYFPKVLGNSFLQGGLCLLAGVVVVFLLTGCAALIKNKWLRCAFLSLILLPTILPMHLFVDILPQAWVTSPALYRLVPVCNEMLRIAPLAVLAGSFALTGNFSWKRVWFVTLCYTGLRLVLFLFPDIQLQLATYNPAVYETADVFGTFTYRSGMMNANYSAGAAAYVVQLILNWLPWLAGGAILLVLTKRFGGSNGRPVSANRAAILPIGILGGSLAAIVVGVLLTFVATLFLKLGAQIFGSVLFAIACCLAAAVFALGLAYPMLAGDRITSAIAVAFGLFLLPLCSNWMGLYLHIRELQAMNTLWGVLFQNATWGILAAVGLLIAAGGRQGLDGKAAAWRILPPAIAFLGIGFCFFYSDAYLYPMLFLQDSSMFPLTLVLRQILLADTAMMADGQMPSELARLLQMAYVVPAFIGLAGIWLSALAIRKDAE